MTSGTPDIRPDCASAPPLAGGHPLDAEPRVRLEADEEQRIQAELAPDYARVAKELRGSARAALYR
jgi:hypothetical protein